MNASNSPQLHPTDTISALFLDDDYLFRLCLFSKTALEIRGAEGVFGMISARFPELLPYLRHYKIRIGVNIAEYDTPSAHCISCIMLVAYNCEFYFCTKLMEVSE